MVKRKLEVMMEMMRGGLEYKKKTNSSINMNHVGFSLHNGSLYRHQLYSVSN